MIVIELESNLSLESKKQVLKKLKDLCISYSEINSTVLKISRPIQNTTVNSILQIKNYYTDAPEYFLSSRKYKNSDSTITIDDFTIGGSKPFIIAGPCSAESYDQLAKTAEFIKAKDIQFFRAGLYKPRTSPYSFQGLKSKGIELMHRIKKEFDLKFVTEIMGTEHVDEVMEVADIIQIGSRNMHNYSLLESIAKTQKPILLKRGMSANIEEFLLAAEYILKEGNTNVILCERGIKTFETTTRNTLDLNAVAFIKQVSHLPIIVDPSHGTGVRSLVTPMSMASLACGANGLIIEVHPNPNEALSDGDQSLTFQDFEELIKLINKQ